MKVLKKIMMKTVIRDKFLMLNILHKPHSNLPFLPERKKIEKCNMLVCTLKDKENCIVHIRALKQALNHGLILKEVHRVTQFNQEA